MSLSNVMRDRSLCGMRGKKGIMKKDFEAVFERETERFIEEWEELLRFPSISTDPNHNADCRSCANWLSDHLETMGFESRLLETASHPVVFAEKAGVPGKPVILFYGHYDVQPVDPVEKWNISPFAPEMRDGRMWARGASDDKGQLFYALKAFETLQDLRVPMPGIKVILDGEEESGSKGLFDKLDEWRDLIQADILMVTDISASASGAPAIVMGLRGILTMTVELSGPSYDLHSGAHGGLAPNPAQGIAELAAGLHGEDGKVAVEGFYDAVKPPTEEERRLSSKSGFDEKEYESVTGVRPCGGEKEFLPRERVGFRPSLEINGIHSGYGGEGSKTIIPSGAFAKISARLTAEQDPEDIFRKITAHLQNHTPEGLTIKISQSKVSGGALRLDSHSAAVAAAMEALGSVTDMKPVFLWEGASIPVVAKLAEVSGAEPLISGFGSEKDCIHAPNESFSLEQFRRGYLYSALMVSKAGGTGDLGM